MSIALIVLGVMLVVAIGIGSVVVPLVAFAMHDFQDTRKPLTRWLAKYRWWTIATPFIVIPLLVVVVASTPLRGDDSSAHCGPGTRYVQMGKYADPSWMCMGEAR